MMEPVRMFIQSRDGGYSSMQVVFWLPVRHVMETSRLWNNQCPAHRLPVTAARPRRIFTVFRYLRWNAINHNAAPSAREMCKSWVNYFNTYNIWYNALSQPLIMKASGGEDPICALLPGRRHEHMVIPEEEGCARVQAENAICPVRLAVLSSPTESPVE